MIDSRPPSRRKNPATFDRNTNLPINQSKILFHIAINGPIDAYRTNKDLAFSLTTTQSVFKILTEEGLIQLKDIVKGKTDQNRKIYDLTPRGFCFITEIFLNKGSGKSYDELKEFLDRHCDLLPDLLKKWDFFINQSRDYFSHNPTDWEQPLYMIPVPDVSTAIWCDILRHTCYSVNRHYEWYGKGITVDEVCNQFKEVLLNELYEDRRGPGIDGFVYALKQDKQLWSELLPELQSFIEDFEDRIAQLKEKLK